MRNALFFVDVAEKQRISLSVYYENIKLFGRNNQIMLKYFAS